MMGRETPFVVENFHKKPLKLHTLYLHQSTDWIDNEPICGSLVNIKTIMPLYK
jgi:hypothetical protein